MTELSAVARRAVEAATAAGAGDAEAYVSREAGRQVRVHGGEVESLTAATQSGVGDPRLERPPGRLRLRHRPLRGRGRSDRRQAPRKPPRSPTRTSSRRRRSRPRSRRCPASATPRSPNGRPPGSPTSPSLSSARRWRPTPAWSASRSPSTPTPTSRSRSPPRPASPATTKSSSCLRLPLGARRRGGGSAETGLGFGLARGPRGLDPEAIGAEGARRALSMIGAGKPASRSCPVVLDETVAASFAGLIGGGLGAKAVQRGRSPFAGRLGEEVASAAFALHDDGRDPLGPDSAPFDAEGVPRRRTALIEGGRLRSYLFDTYTANREGTASTGSAARQGYRSLPVGLALEPDRRPRRALARAACWPRRARASTSPTSPASTPASTRSPASSRSAPRAGSSATAPWPSRCASSRSPASWWRC